MFELVFIEVMKYVGNRLFLNGNIYQLEKASTDEDGDVICEGCAFENKDNCWKIECPDDGIYIQVNTVNEYE